MEGASRIKHTHALCLPCTARASPQPVVHRLAFDWRCSTFEPLGTPRLVVFELGMVDIDVNIINSSKLGIRNRKSPERRIQ